MKIVVPVKMVPDLVEELRVDESGASLDTQWLRLILNEFDEHAIEQAILLKERTGGEVIVIAPEAEGLDDALFTAAAKGVDKLIRLTGDFQHLNSHALARTLLPLIQDIKSDLVLTGVQAHNDLDGQAGPLLAGLMDCPYVGYVSGVQSEDGKVVVRKEYPGGLLAEIEINLPAVLGIQASDEPPRYVAFTKVRQAMQATKIEEQSTGELDLRGGATVKRLSQPQAANHATVMEGNADEVATRLLEIMQEHGVI